MKVVQINTVYGGGSTGRTTMELHNALKENGIESYAIFGVGNKVNDKNVFKSQTKFSYYLNNVFSRLFGNEGFGAFFSTLKICRKLKQIKPDIVHLRNLHGHYVNVPMLFKTINKINAHVVASTHDLWLFTGGCPSPLLYNCDKWQSSCGKCPSLHDYPSSWIFDSTKRKFKKKKKLIESLKDFHIVGVSKWTRDMVCLSPIAIKDKRYIYNWIDVDKFVPCSRQADNDIQILCVSAIWQKGSKKMDDLIYIAKNLPQNCHINLIGYADFDINSLGLGNISIHPKMSPDELVTFYSSNDIYLHLSHSDTFGKVIAEALSCGTPIIAFDVTAMSEMIEPGCGVKIKDFDLDKTIEAIKTLGKKSQETIDRCRESAVRRFSKENITQTINLYKEITNNGN